MVLASTLLTLLLLEGAMRLWRPQSEYAITWAPWGFIHQPNATITYYTEKPRPGRKDDSGIPPHPVKIHYNAHGFREFDYPYAKPPGTFRILFLGDSWAEDMGSYFENLHTKHLERKLNALGLPQKFEVINAGHYAYDNAQELMLYLNEGIKFQPDLVTVLYVGDTAKPELATVEQGELRLHDQRYTPIQKFYRAIVTWTRSHSHLGSFLLNELYRVKHIQQWLVAHKWKEAPVPVPSVHVAVAAEMPPQAALIPAPATPPKTAAPAPVVPAQPTAPSRDPLVGVPTGVNLLLNSSFGSWSLGDEDDPDYWVAGFTTPGFSVKRAVTDARHGRSACRLINQTPDGCRLSQDPVMMVDPAGQRLRWTQLRGKTVTAGCWVKTSTPEAVWLFLHDGISGAESPRHSGSGAWEFLTTTLNVPGAASSLDYRVMVGKGATVDVDAATLALGRRPAQPFLPEGEEADQIAAHRTKIREQLAAAQGTLVPPSQLPEELIEEQDAEFALVDQLIWKKFRDTAKAQGGQFIFLSVSPLTPSERLFLKEAGIPWLSFKLPFNPNERRQKDLLAGRYDPSQDSHRFGYQANAEVAEQMLQYLKARQFIPMPQPQHEGAGSRRR
ncbi:MAG: hypothetical protein HY597_06790 [Candidatus Omnitrophica bacterium]|nr:hypothetical protein [Candidatus Omnitrophota bacterium]